MDAMPSRVLVSWMARSTVRWTKQYSAKSKNNFKKSTTVFLPIHQDCQRANEEILNVRQQCRNTALKMAEEAEKAANYEIMKEKKDRVNDGSVQSDSETE